MATLTATSAPSNKRNGKPPAYPPPDFSKVPDRLANLSRWVCWYPKWIEDKQGNGKWTKVPVSPNSHLNFTRKAEECVSLEGAKKVFTPLVIKTPRRTGGVASSTQSRAR